MKQEVNRYEMRYQTQPKNKPIYSSNWTPDAVLASGMIPAKHFYSPAPVKIAAPDIPGRTPSDRLFRLPDVPPDGYGICHWSRQWIGDRG